MPENETPGFPGPDVGCAVHKPCRLPAPRAAYSMNIVKLEDLPSKSPADENGTG